MNPESEKYARAAQSKVKSYIKYEDFEFDPRGWWIFPFGNRVIKTQSWFDLPTPPKEEGIQISIVVINWDRPFDMVESCIASILDQDFPPESFEVILVDDASRRISPKPACLKIVRDYPKHNFRAYLLKSTRCYQDTHVYNVGLKRALGWIVTIFHTDAVFDENVLEGTWRHHNAIENLGLCPQMLYMPEENEIKYWYSFPHPMGFSFNKKYVEATHGFNEAKYSDGPVTDFRVQLDRLGIVYAEDTNMQVIHRDYMIPKNVYGPYPEVLRPMPENHSFPDWPNSWGQLSESEEEKVIISNELKNTLKTLKG